MRLAANGGFEQPQVIDNGLIKSLDLFMHTPAPALPSASPVGAAGPLLQERIQPA